GEQYDLPLPFEPKYRMKGLYFVFGKNGGIDLIKTFKKINSFRLLKEIRQFPIEKYDLVISDFEPISCWAANLKNVKCIGLSNQAATLHPNAPVPKSFDPLGKLILEYYAPVSEEYGFHFKSLSDKIFTPIIRKEVRESKISDKGHYTLYLPAYDDERIIKNLKKFRDIKFEVFSKHNKKPLSQKNIRILPKQGKKFLQRMASAHGVICNAGFGTTSE
ncbi:MAG TPA: glycosyltransferase family protein, partial [Bacteroidia bacterium]|nr:glycosyltransferase family protein [Bacteroidia bacterium]